MKKLLVLACALFIVGCEDMDGTTQVYKSFSAVTGDSTQVVAAGTYETALNFKRKEVIATLKTGHDDIQISIRIPKGTSIPDNGSFEFKSEQSGQPFDLTGVNKTDVTNSNRQTEYSSCQYTRYENYCTPQGCYTRPVTVWGRQFTDFYYRTTDQTMQFNINGKAAKDLLAHFAGHAKYTEKVIVQQSQCW